MTKQEYRLLKMRHDRLVAEIKMFTAIANRELSRGEWLYDWGAEMARCSHEAQEIEAKIEKERRRQ